MYTFTIIVVALIMSHESLSFQSKRMKKRRKQVRLHDIAIEAGVSVNTVSRALRDKSDVKNETREMVLRIAKKLGYIPPETSTPQENSISIGVLIQDIHNPFYTRIVQGIEHVIWQERAKFLFGCSYQQESKERDLCRFFYEQQVDGLLVGSVVNPGFLASALRTNNIPTIALSQCFQDFGVDYVINDNYAGAFMSMEHLLKLGHRQIAHIAGPDAQTSAQDRLRGYLDALKEAGIEHENRLIRISDTTVESGYYLMKDLLHASEKLTAVFAYNDLVALGAFRAIREAQRRVPTEISLIGYDDIAITEYFEVPLTTVHQPMQEIGRKAAELLFEKIRHGMDYQSHHTVLKPRLTIRSSTSICPV
ncbi:hypothetical protein CSB45_02475 [candidate division KSB3 bacterium]|uniref:HTH lacI-type domain-containing protein n=1 Tax=candidate division KSB3 bacterium TaxID=2044937 RepID=A0A2G6EA03_9BACT|nr:MAG: hypothetical protein CSB45_02475 [candidate division KSB3 bacterium]PIE30946.1 MAG: hypothetical protein CSA57_01090 [candidate division KSB3 bacterium]